MRNNLPALKNKNIKAYKVDTCECPLNSLLATLVGKWSVRIICKLSKYPEKKARFSLIKQDIKGISQRMLTITLRTLERDGIVKRYVFSEIPPRVEYQLTKLGESMLVVVQTLTEWLEDNWAEINTSREEFDKKLGKPTKNREYK